MTAPAPEVLDREQEQADDRWVTDAEIIRRCGLSEKIARPNFRMLDRNPKSGFPRKSAYWGNRRWLPAVLAYFNRINGLNSASQPQRERERRYG